MTSCSQLLSEPHLRRVFETFRWPPARKQQSRPLISFEESVGNMYICYILDGILILYGIILTVLYCRLRMVPVNRAASVQHQKQPAEGGIYAGLTSHSTDTYETIRMDKKPIV